MFRRFSLITSFVLAFILLFGCSNAEVDKGTKIGQKIEHSAMKENIEITTILISFFMLLIIHSKSE